MKKTLIVIAMIVASCKPEADLQPPLPPEPLEPTAIEGLDLKFIDIETGWGYTSLQFIDESTGYITGYAGAIMKTTDGGNSWTDLKADNYLPLNDLYFLNANEGWAAGGAAWCTAPGCTPRGAILLHTTDAGATWTEIRVPLSKPIVLNAVWFNNSNTGFAGGENLIARTTDGGKTWQETTLDLSISPGITGHILALQFIDDQYGIASADAGRLVRTDDGGVTWKVTSSPNNEPGYMAVALSKDKLVYAGGQTGIYSSSDYGTTWNVLPNHPMIIQHMNFVSQNTGFAFGMGYQNNEGDDDIRMSSMYYTKDGGQTWKGTSQVHEMSMLLDASFPVEQTGYALGDEGIVRIRLK